MLYKFETYINQLFAGITDSVPKHIVLKVLNPNNRYGASNYILPQDMVIADGIALFYKLQLRGYITNHGPWLKPLCESLPQMLENMAEDIVTYSPILITAISPNMLDVKAKVKEFALEYATYCARNRRQSDPEVRHAIAREVIDKHGDTLRSPLLTFREAWQDAATKNTDISSVAYLLPIDNELPSRYDIEMTVRVVVSQITELRNPK